MLDNLGYKHTVRICIINDFQLHQSMQEIPSILPYKYIARPVL
jgi:hypothetical protein